MFPADFWLSYRSCMVSFSFITLTRPMKGCHVVYIVRIMDHNQLDAHASCVLIEGQGGRYLAFKCHGMDPFQSLIHRVFSSLDASIPVRTTHTEVASRLPHSPPVWSQCQGHTNPKRHYFPQVTICQPFVSVRASSQSDAAPIPRYSSE